MRNAVILALLISTGSSAALGATSDTPPKPSYEELQRQVMYWQAVAKVISQQRDTAQQELANQQALTAAAQAYPPAKP